MLVVDVVVVEVVVVVVEAIEEGFVVDEGGHSVGAG